MSKRILTILCIAILVLLVLFATSTSGYLVAVPRTIGLVTISLSPFAVLVTLCIRSTRKKKLAELLRIHFPLAKIAGRIATLRNRHFFKSFVGHAFGFVGYGRIY